MRQRGAVRQPVQHLRHASAYLVRLGLLDTYSHAVAVTSRVWAVQKAACYCVPQSGKLSALDQAVASGNSVKFDRGLSEPLDSTTSMRQIISAQSSARIFNYSQEQVFKAVESNHNNKRKVNWSKGYLALAVRSKPIPKNLVTTTSIWL